MAICWLLLAFAHQLALKIIGVCLKLFEFPGLSSCSVMPFSLKLSACLFYIPRIQLIRMFSASIHLVYLFFLFIFFIKVG
jgi:hypothetical protein